jgi:hypothetical protein
MNRLALMIGCLMLLMAPAYGTQEFSKQWKEKFAGEGTNEEFANAVKSAGCNVCHVKDQDKKKVRNEYGQAINKYLKAKDFPKDYLKDKPEEAKKKIVEGFEKAGDAESKDGKKFSEKIKAGQLPASDSGIQSAQ